MQNLAKLEVRPLCGGNSPWQKLSHRSLIYCQHGQSTLGVCVIWVSVVAKLEGLCDLSLNHVGVSKLFLYGQGYYVSPCVHTEYICDSWVIPFELSQLHQ